MGKSACAAVLRDAGVPVADADAAVHELYAPGGAAVEPVAAAFGREVLGADGGVDRRALGALVVGNDAAMKTLEGVVHPLVAAHRERWLEERDAEGHEVRARPPAPPAPLSPPSARSAAATATDFPRVGTLDPSFAARARWSSWTSRCSTRRASTARVC